ncbi:gallidermin family protein [Brevibacillus laterosporus]|nr:gallidermin family lantibiotic [Brevibacillus laterosporus]TPG82413.1 gallidermin family protein [Brevibacillus laterosporus]
MKKDDLFDLDVQVKEVKQVQPDSVISNLLCTVTCSVTWCGKSNCFCN